MASLVASSSKDVGLTRSSRRSNRPESPLGNRSAMRAATRWASASPKPASPPGLALAGLRAREVHDVANAPHERDVDVLHLVACEQGHALELLEELEQVVGVGVGVAVVRVADLRALAEEGVGLVEEQHGVHF